MKPFHLRLIGVTLLALFVFSAISLASFSPGDAPDSQTHPQPQAVRNLCGTVGAWTASVLLNAVGWTSFFLFLPLLFGTVRLIRGKAIDQLPLRILGLGFVLFGLSGLFGLFGLFGLSGLSVGKIPLHYGPKIGPGGYLGASSALFLNQYVTLVGSVSLLAGFSLGGMLLLGDRTILRILGFFFVFGKNEPRSGHVPDQAAEVVLSDGDESQRRNVQNSGDAASDPTRDDPTRDAPAQPSQAGGLMHWLRTSQPNRMERQFERAGRSEELLPETDVPEFENEEEYQLPSPELLTEPEPFDEELYVDTIRQQAELLEAAFADFGLKVQVVDIQTGPVISQFELKLAKGLRLNKIQALSDDLAIAMKVPSVRIVAPIPGKNTVGVELPNEHRQTVRLRDVMEQLPEADSKYNIPVFLGKDVSGRPMVVDLTKLPHLLIAGRTGTGKSVCLNSIIVSMLMTRSPEQVRMLMIDPKMVELSPYKTIPHLMHPVVTDMRKAEAILAWAVEKMEQRYQLLAAAGVRQIGEFNKLSEYDLRRRMKMLDSSEEEWEAIPKNMPYTVIIADEMADLMMTAAKEVETHIIRLAQKSRAVGIHLVLATQKPTVDIVTGLIKSNLPARIAFGVASRTDSQVVLDKTGAERLLGNGDMLFLQPGTSQVVRGQGTFVSDAEIEAIIESIGTEEQDFVEELVAIDPDQFDADSPTAAMSSKKEDDKVHRDELYDEAVEYVIREGRGSLSLLQRRFSIGYGRAARLIDFMAEDGVVGAYNGSQAREVVMTLADWKRGRERSESVAKPGERLAVTEGVPIRSVGLPEYDDVYDDVYEEEYEDEYDYCRPI